MQWGFPQIHDAVLVDIWVLVERHRLQCLALDTQFLERKHLILIVQVLGEPFLEDDPYLCPISDTHVTLPAR